MPTILVGGRETPAKWSEYHASILPENTPVEWWAETVLHPPESGTGIFLFASWYDGVVAHIDTGGARKMLHLECGRTRMKRLKNTLRLNGQGIGGEGI